MVDVAQLVRALVCGTRGRGFESHLPPHYILGCSQAVRHQTLTLACASSNLASPASDIKTFEKSKVLNFIKNSHIYPKLVEEKLNYVNLNNS